jgi:hypothetical protein
MYTYIIRIFKLTSRFEFLLLVYKNNVSLQDSVGAVFKECRFLASSLLHKYLTSTFNVLDFCNGLMLAA